MGSSASATAGGKSLGRPCGGVLAPNAIVREAEDAGATAPVPGTGPPMADGRAAIANESWVGIVRVAFGITVLLKRSLLGFSKGVTGFRASTGCSFLTRAWSFTFLKKFRNGIVMVI
jgi:hypothetical protein